MAMIPCPECGKQISDRAYSCPECGCPINAAPVVATQNVADEIQKLLVLARRSREASDGKNAMKYYEQILSKDPGNWEAIFFAVYYDAQECKIMNISSAANTVANSIYTTFAAIADLTNEEEKNEAINTVASYASVIAMMFVAGAVNHYNNHPTVDGAFGECANRVVAAGNIYMEIEESLKKCFPENRVRIADHQKNLAQFMTTYSKWYNASYLTQQRNRLAAEIYAVDPYYVFPMLKAPATSGCYVATAVYGSYDCPQVWTLRRYRDYTLAESWYGRAFIKTYYAISPTLVKWFGETRWFKKMWQGKLDRMVAKLQAKGVESTPYEDRQW